MCEFEIGFNTVGDGEWPPVGVEFLWVRPTSEGFEVLNQPFLKDISVGDILKIDFEEKTINFSVSNGRMLSHPLGVRLSLGCLIMW